MLSDRSVLFSTNKLPENVGTKEQNLWVRFAAVQAMQLVHVANIEIIKNIEINCELRLRTDFIRITSGFAMWNPSTGNGTAPFILCTKSPKGDVVLQWSRASGGGRWDAGRRCGQGCG
jgi:hypothetical protein